MVADKIIPPGVKIHGILMMGAFVILAPAGIFIARYLKNVIGVRWYRVHIATQIGVLVLAAVAFGSILIAKEGKILAHPHTYLGLTILTLAFLQPITGYICNLMWTAGRLPGWADKFHWWGGRIAVLCALFNVGIGFHQVKLPLDVVGVLTLTIYLTMFGLFLYVEARMGPAISYIDRNGEELPLNTKLSLPNRVGDPLPYMQYVGPGLFVLALYLAVLIYVAAHP